MTWLIQKNSFRTVKNPFQENNSFFVQISPLLWPGIQMQMCQMERKKLNNPIHAVASQLQWDEHEFKIQNFNQEQYHSLQFPAALE